MKISACVIVKNEEKNIGTWLENMAQFADEMIVVDTGSTDKTKEIVAASSAQLYEFPWINDFAAAKNFALSKAKGEWIAFLDADEFFSRDSIPLIRKWLKKLHFQKKNVGVMCRLINIDTGKNNRFIGSAVQLRLFRNKPFLKYVGAIHEALDVPKHCVVELVDDLEIYHTGYSEAVIKKKLQRDLQMLQKKVASQDNKPTPRDYRYLTDCYYGLGDYEQAMENACKSLDYKDALRDTLHHIYIVYIGCHIFGKHDYEKTTEAFAEARAEYPQSADFYLMEGLYNNDQKNYLAAQQLLEKGIELSGTRKMDMVGVADNSRSYLPNACHILGRLYKWQGRIEDTLAFYVRGLRIYHYHEKMLNDLVQELLSIGAAPVDIIEILSTIYKDDMDYKFIVKGLTFKAPGTETIYMYYARKAGGMDTIKTYQAAGRWETAALIAGNELAWSHRSGLASALALGKSPDASLAVFLPPRYQHIWQEMASGRIPSSPGAMAEMRLLSRLRDKLEMRHDEEK